MVLKRLTQLTIFLPLFLMGCYTTTMMQTAETLGKGVSDWTGGVYVLSQDHYDQNPDGDQIPGIDMMYRHGLGERIDFGLSYSPALDGGHFRTDIKYNFFRSHDNNHYLSGLFSLETEHFFNDIVSSPYFGSGIGLVFSTNHTNRIVPFFYQRMTFGISELQVFYGSASSFIFENYNTKSHRMHYIGGLGLMLSSIRHPKIIFFTEFSYFNRRLTFFETIQSQNNQDQILVKSSLNRLNLQLVFGLKTRIGGLIKDK